MNPEENTELDELKSNLQTSYDGLKDSSRTITNSAKMIDFFVHDILDYAVLRSKNQKFKKNIQIFNIKEVIEEVVDILKDKAIMKNIDIQLEFKGFISR